MVFFSGIQQKLFSFSRRSCIAVPAAGHAGGGGRLYGTVQVWIPARLGGACSGSSKVTTGWLCAELEPSKAM